MPEGHDTTIEISNMMSFVLYTQILKQSVLKPASQGITLRLFCENLSKIAVKISVLWGCKCGVYASRRKCHVVIYTLRHATFDFCYFIYKHHMNPCVTIWG